MPTLPIPINIKFDFRHYIPNQDLSAGVVRLDGNDCADKSLVVTLLASNLIPGHIYRTTYQLLSPITTTQVFNPASSTLYASSSVQNFVTSVVLPRTPNTVVNSYILTATVIDATEGVAPNIGSTQINLICAGIERQVFTVELLDTDMPRDDVINLADCSTGFPLIGVIRNVTIGKEYSYQFYGNPTGGVLFEKAQGSVFAGDINQNFNSRIALSGYPYVFVHAKVTEKDTGISSYSDPLLLKCYQSDPCAVVLPTGVNVTQNTLIMKACQAMGCTEDSLVRLNGGKNLAIGDKLSFGGGDSPCVVAVTKIGLGLESINKFCGGSGIKVGSLFTAGGGSVIKVESVGLTNNSINSLNGCSGFNIGDLLTTVGGGGNDAVIRVVSTGTNGNISTVNVINPGYNFTQAPTGIRKITGQGACASASFNMDNGTIPCKGGITNDSFTVCGGSGYQLGETININGAGGQGGKAQVIALSLTDCSINTLSGGTGYIVGDYITTSGCGGKDAVIKVSLVSSSGSIQGWTIINGGYDYICVPTHINNITGNGTGATFSGNDCWAMQCKGGVSKESLIAIIGSGPGYNVGDKLYVEAGGCKGGIIEITRVDNLGIILDFIIINPGCCCVGVPTISNEDGNAIVPQPAINKELFIKDPIVITEPGCCYDPRIGDGVILTDGTGNPLPGYPLWPDRCLTIGQCDLIPNQFSIPNGGSFPPPNSPIVPPTSLPPSTGNLPCCVQAEFKQPLRGSLPCKGKILKGGISGLIGLGPDFSINDQIAVVDGPGGSGEGALLQVTAVSGGLIAGFEVYNGGCYYSIPPQPIFKRLPFGTILTGPQIATTGVTGSPITVIEPGDIKGDGCATCCETVTGYGDCPPQTEILFNDHLVTLPFAPTPPVTPTPTITPSASSLMRCDDIQSAGGQNTLSSTTLFIPAPSGQSYLIVNNNNNLILDTIVYANGISAGTYITSIIDWFSDVTNRTSYKKITLSDNIISNIPAATVLSIYNVDIRLLKVPYWRGVMTFSYDAYRVPDRFKVIAVPTDTRNSEILLFDSGYRGSEPCGYANNLTGTGGAGSVQIIKPDGCTIIKIVVEAPCDQTAWEYSLSCPERVFTTVTSTPTRTPTLTPTRTPTLTPTVTTTPSRSL